VTLNFTLPGRKEPIEVDGVVRWARDLGEADLETPPGMGIEFGELSEEAERAISMFIRRKGSLFAL